MGRPAHRSEQFIARLALRLGLTDKAARAFANGLFEEIADTTLRRREPVLIRHFGVFSRRVFKGGPLPGGGVVGRRARIGFVASVAVKGIAID